MEHELIFGIMDITDLLELCILAPLFVWYLYFFLRLFFRLVRNVRGD